jgi:glucosyl-3-phosphoglycerate synthase
VADFFQNGLISTLQKLGERPLDSIEKDLREFSEKQKIVLILPALFSEFETDSMTRIISELAGADYIHRFIVSLDKADEEQFHYAKKALSSLPSEVKVLWHDGPRIRRMLGELESADFTIAEQGKGRGVWMAMGYALTDKEVYTIALHDCDIFSYKREMLARLIYPIASPSTDYEFSKGYYARIDGKLYGRVTRLFYTPLIRSLQQLEPARADRFLQYMDSFRYALSGEFAFIRSLAKSIRISPSWGLEVSMLAEVFEHTTVQRVCQVELAESYHHKHQDLAKGEPSKGLTKMSADIAGTLFRVLAQGGITLAPSFFNTLLATYGQMARRAIEQYQALARLNGLEYNRHDEIEAVESFVSALRHAQQEFQEDPLGVPLLSAWVRVRAGVHGFTRRLREAIEADNAV